MTVKVDEIGNVPLPRWSFVTSKVDARVHAARLVEITMDSLMIWQPTCMDQVVEIYTNTPFARLTCEECIGYYSCLAKWPPD